MTPAQAAREAFISGCVRRGITAAQVVAGSAAEAACVWNETAKAAVDAALAYGDTPVCPRDHWRLGRDVQMDRVLTVEGGWACPGIRPDRSGDCGFTLERAGGAP